MEAINNAFYIISDKIIELQSFFLSFANKVAYAVLLVAVLTAAVNYALTGTGLKENIIKIGKALVFFSIVIFAYPNIVGWITEITFSLAKDSTASGISSNLKLSQKEMEDLAIKKELDNEKWTYGTMAVLKYNSFFSGMLNNRTFTNAQGKSYSYSTVAPAYAIKSIILVAGECLRLGDNFSVRHLGQSIGNIIKGYLCAFFILIVGTFCILEYLIAFIEFLFVSSVGVILFPLSLWDGTKFIAEKYIGAMLGFFVKLLFCTICIFLMLYIFTSLSNNFTKEPFLGQIEQIATLAFSALLTFYISKSAPALAQGLLSGTPSLSGAGAIGMVASTVMAASRLSSLAGGSGSSSPQLPPSQSASAISGGSGASASSGGSGGVAIASQPPQVFSLPQDAPDYPAPSLPAYQPYMAIEDRPSELTRSLSYNSRPLIQGPGSGGAIAMLPPPNYSPGPNRRDPDVTYEVVG